MTHQEKVEHLIEELDRQGVSSYTVAPPLFRLLWALGLEVPPPLFLRFLSYTVLMETTFGVLFGVLWGVCMWLWVWQGQLPGGFAVLLSALAGLLAGAIFGVVMAVLIRRKAAQLELPSSWEDYPQEEA
jgi:Family of unknown function (DUF6404)